MPTPRRSVALLCIAAVTLAALVPGVSGLASALIEPQWTLLPDLPSSPAAPPAPTVDEQPLSLFALLPSRAPPAPLT